MEKQNQRQGILDHFRKHLLLATICTVILLAVLVSVAGHIIIFSNEQLMDYAYRELSYDYLAEKITNATDPATIAWDTTEFVYQNVYLPGNSSVIDDNSWNVLSRGFGFCGQQSFFVSALLEKKDIPARWVTLRNKEKNEPHAVVEVLVNDRWQIYDPLYGYRYEMPDGNIATLQEICENPNIITQNEKALALQEFTDFNFTLHASFYCNEPRRFPPYGQDRNLQRKVVLQFLAFHNALLGEFYAKQFQGLYLWRKAASLKEEDRLYFKARQYHLYQRFDKALQGYRAVMTLRPETKWKDEALLFSGIILCKEKQAYEEGIALLRQVPELPLSPVNWTSTVRYFLGQCYEGKQDWERALKRYNKSGYDLHIDSSVRFFQLQRELEEE